MTTVLYVILALMYMIAYLVTYIMPLIMLYSGITWGWIFAGHPDNSMIPYLIFAALPIVFVPISCYTVNWFTEKYNIKYKLIHNIVFVSTLVPLAVWSIGVALKSTLSVFSFDDTVEETFQKGLILYGTIAVSLIIMIAVAIVSSRLSFLVEKRLKEKSNVLTMTAKIGICTAMVIVVFAISFTFLFVLWRLRFKLF